jgi:hypothetical protein
MGFVSLFYGLKAFASGFLFFSYFTSSKLTLFILPLNIYNIPHISFFILHNILLKYYKNNYYFFSFFFPTISSTPMPAPQNPPKYKPNHTHAGNATIKPTPTLAAPPSNPHTHAGSTTTTIQNPTTFK